MPTSINLDILYSEGGYSNDKQKIIISAKVYLTYEDFYYIENNNTGLFHFEINSKGRFIKLEKSNLAKDVIQPTILPPLPFDLVNPLTNEMDF